jgi:hypothetical protein
VIDRGLIPSGGDVFIFVVNPWSTFRAHPIPWPTVTEGSFPRCKGGQSEKLTINLRLVLKLKMYCVSILCKY